MRGSTRSPRAQIKNKEYYKCATRGTGHSFQTADPIDEMVTEFALARLSDDDARTRLSAPQNMKRVIQLQTELVVLRGLLDQASNAFAEGLIQASQLVTITASLRHQTQAAQNELAALSSGSAVPPVEVGNIRDWWENASIESWRAVIQAMMDISIKAVNITAPRHFDPWGVEVVWK